MKAKVRILCIVGVNLEIFKDISEVIFCHIIIKCPRKILKPTMPKFAHVTFLDTKHHTQFQSQKQRNNHRRIPECRVVLCVFFINLAILDFLSPDERWFLLPTPNITSPTFQHQIGVLQFSPVLTLAGVSVRLHRLKGSVPQGCPNFRCQFQVLALPLPALLSKLEGVRVYEYMITQKVSFYYVAL